MKFKISFDFDDCLENQDAQELVRELNKLDKFEIHITTNRPDNSKWNKDVRDVAKKLDIKHINYLDTQDKSKFLKGFAFHLDDDKDEIKKINNNTNCIGIHYNKTNEWYDDIDELAKTIDVRFLQFNSRLNELFPGSELRLKKEWIISNMIVAWCDKTHIQPRIFFRGNQVEFHLEIQDRKILSKCVDYSDIDIAFESFMLICEKELNHRKEQLSRQQDFPYLYKDIRNNKLINILNI